MAPVSYTHLDVYKRQLESPAAATFTDHEIPLGEKPIVLVKDCREALQKAAAWYREQLAIPVVGITGSVGKTTAKEMVAQALTAKFRVLKTAGNQNSQVGVPITPTWGVADLNVGLLYILAIAGLAVYAVLFAGWSSNNKYSLLGSLRASAQTLSYEVFRCV